MRVAVVGAGVIGSATTAFLRGAGADVVCYEAVAPLSQRSTGTSRIFRLAHGTPELVDLARAALRSYRGWGANLVSDCGLAVHGDLVTEWADAMATARAAYRLEDPARLDLPTRSLPGPVLVDPAGGVLDVHRIGAYLAAEIGRVLVPERVERIEHRGDGTRLWTAGGRRDVDAAVLAAGAGTPPLAAQVGIDLPGAVTHHVRFTFPLRDRAARPMCLIERGGFRQPGFSTYQHLTAPGRWAVGAHLGPDEVARAPDRASFTARARELTARYVHENLDGVEADPVDELYCDVPSPAGDGYVVERSGGVLAVHGNNLFKLAPVLGQMLGEAVLTGSTPPSTRGAGGTSAPVSALTQVPKEAR